MSMGVLPACMYLHSWCMQRSEGDTGFPVAGVTDGYEAPYGCEELNPSPLDGYLVVNCWTISPAPAYSSPYNRVCVSISQSKFSPTKNTLPTSSQPFTHFQKFQTLIWNRNAFITSFVLYRIVLTAKCVWGTRSQTSGSWVWKSLDSFKVNTW